jgi:hypothetical protein
MSRRSSEGPPEDPPSVEPPKLVLLPGRGRPEPPSKLTQAEQKAWRAIVDASPDGFLDGAAQLLLRQVVAEIAVADRHAERLRRMAVSRHGVALEDELAIGRAHRDVVKSIIAGMTALRATPRSRVRPRDAARAFHRSPSGPRPWDDLDDDPPA